MPSSVPGLLLLKGFSSNLENARLRLRLYLSSLAIAIEVFPKEASAGCQAVWIGTEEGS